MKNKRKIIICKGLPASGKSTWAKEQVEKGNGEWVRINKDDLRAMLHNSKHSKEREKQIVEIRNQLIMFLRMQGKNIIIDDTNFAPIHEQKIRDLNNSMQVLDGLKYKVEVKFFDVDVSECIKRDALRGEKSVGEKVIRQMYNQYLRTPPKYRPFKQGLPNAIICDIDGTLAHMNGRSPYDYDKVGSDLCDESIKHICNTYEDMGIKVCIVSGRKSICFDDTEEWLKINDIRYTSLSMRKTDDNREDSIVKQEIYEKNIKDLYNVIFVIDDRLRVIKMWKSLNLKVLNVGDNVDF